MQLPISEDERDCLQEICNVSMGAAAESLAEITKHFVALPIPKIRYHEVADIVDSLECLSGEGLISAVMQSFTLYGVEALSLLVVGDSGFKQLAKEIRGEQQSDDTEQLLSGMSAVLDEVCLPVMAEQLGQGYPDISSPKLLCLHQPLSVFEVTQLPVDGNVLTVEINYRLEGSDFNCDLILIFPEYLIADLQQTFEQLL